MIPIPMPVDIRAFLLVRVLESACLLLLVPFWEQDTAEKFARDAKMDVHHIDMASIADRMAIRSAVTSTRLASCDGVEGRCRMLEQSACHLLPVPCS